MFAAKFLSGGVSVGIGFLGVATAFGLTVLTGVYAFGTISGGHFNPAVTLGAALARRVEWKALPGYWIVQVIGGLLAGLVIYLIAKGKEGFTATGNMAANGFGEHSPGGYSLWAVIVAEIVLTGVFLLVILGSTDDRAPKGFAGLAIGLTPTLIHLISIPISNMSVNPARSTGVAFFKADQLGVHSSRLGVGGRVGLPQDFFAHGQIEASGATSVIPMSPPIMSFTSRLGGSAPLAAISGSDSSERLSQLIGPRKLHHVRGWQPNHVIGVRRPRFLRSHRVVRLLSGNDVSGRMCPIGRGARSSEGCIRLQAKAREHISGAVPVQVLAERLRASSKSSVISSAPSSRRIIEFGRSPNRSSTD